jgi:hypothetical protein
MSKRAMDSAPATDHYLQSSTDLPRLEIDMTVLTTSPETTGTASATRTSPRGILDFDKNRLATPPMDLEARPDQH